MNNSYQEKRDNVYNRTKMMFTVISVIFTGGLFVGVKFLPENLFLYSLLFWGAVTFINFTIVKGKHDFELSKINLDESLEEKEKQKK